MKSDRHATIMKLIADEVITTQDEMVTRLNELGYRVTQATVSRDIRELGLAKETDVTGLVRYVPSSSGAKTAVARSERERFTQMFINSVLGIQSANNMIVLHTLSGAANAAAEALDGLHWPEILGTMAGDNTIFVVVRANHETPEIVKRLERLLRGK